LIGWLIYLHLTVISAQNRYIVSFCIRETVESVDFEIKIKKVVQIAYMCITTNQPETKANPNSNNNHKPTTKQHTIMNI